MLSLGRSLDSNELCGINRFGWGTYTAEGITKIAEMLQVNGTLQSIKCVAIPEFQPKVSAATDTPDEPVFDSLAD